jgi:hypothetical protein
MREARCHYRKLEQSQLEKNNHYDRLNASYYERVLFLPTFFFHLDKQHASKNY